MSKLFLIIFNGLLEVFCIFVLAESELRKRPKGEMLLNLVETGTVKFTNWRANADAREEIEKIKRFSGWSFLLILALTLVAISSSLQWLIAFLIPFFLVSLFVYVSLNWTFNWQAIFKLYGVIFLLAIISTPSYYYLEMPEYRQLAELSVLFARLLGAGEIQPSLTLTMSVSAGTFLLALILMTVVACIISLSIFTPLWLTTKVSDLFKRRFHKDYLWWTAFVTQLFLVVLNGVINMM